jgi:hypothetical protein
MFRFGPPGAPEDGARIFSIVQNNRYKVRAVTVTENTNTVSGAIAGFYAPKEIPVRTDTRWVTFANDKYGILKKKPSIYVCEVQHRIPMSLTVENTNTALQGNDAMWGRNPADMGHVYYLQDCQSLPFKWKTVIEAHQKKMIDPTEWTWVESARVYDFETVTLCDSIFSMAVLSDKYYVDSVVNPTKIGSHFLIRQSEAQSFIKSINDKFGFAAYGTLQTSYVREKQSDLLERITVVKDELRSAVQSRDIEKILNVLFDSIEFRDKAVDELKELNQVIGEARNLAVELTNGSPAGSH